MGDVCVSADWLESLRTILLFGFLLTLGAVIWDNRKDIFVGPPPLKKSAYELCKLHQRPTNQCRDMHVCQECGGESHQPGCKFYRGDE